MHHVCRDFLIANSLNAADVDGDGFEDYSVIDERRGLMTIVLHPGKTGDVRKEWPRLILGQSGNPEYACLGDLDSDGAPDFITVEGDDLSKGLATGVRVFWSPGRSKAREAAAWQDAGRFPGTENAQYLYAECHDLNSDGALDLVVGGRRHSITKQYAGLRWLRAPADRKARRDLSQWTTHFLDPDTPSGHGFVFADLNGDGRLDLVGALIHNDGNLPKDKASVFWLENNGGSPETWKPYPIKWSDGANTRDPWIGEKWDHLLPLDVDGDGDLDLLGNVEEHYHRGPDGKEVSWLSVVWFENPRK